MGLPILVFFLQSPMTVGNSTVNRATVPAAQVKCHCPSKNAPILAAPIFFLIKAKISQKKKKKNHTAKKAKGMLVPVPRSHIYLFLVPSKAQYTVISIITCSLPQGHMTQLTPGPHLGIGRVLWVVLSAVDLDSLLVLSHLVGSAIRHLQERGERWVWGQPDLRGKNTGQTGVWGRHGEGEHPWIRGVTSVKANWPRPL